jgi:hypothetical protein
MNKVLLIFIGIAFFFLESAYGQEKDSIILYNGQILIGEVQNGSLGEIYIDDIDLKMQHIKLFKIRRLKIVRPFKIITVDKKLYYGSINPSTKDGWVDILVHGQVAASTSIKSLFVLISLDKQFFKRLEGSVSAGLSFTKSNSIGQMNINANLLYATRLFDFQLSALELASIDSSTFSRDNESVQLFVDYDLSTTWFLASVSQYQRNIELSVSRRLLQMAGAGKKIFMEKTWQLLAISGISINQEKSTESVNSSLQFEVPVMLKFNYFKFRRPDIQVTSTQSVYFSLSEKGRVRFDGATNFSWQLVRYFYFNVSPYTNFDNRPPAGSDNKFDFGIVVGIAYTF